MNPLKIKQRFLCRGLFRLFPVLFAVFLISHSVFAEDAAQPAAQDPQAGQAAAAPDAGGGQPAAAAPADAQAAQPAAAQAQAPAAGGTAPAGAAATTAAAPAGDKKADADKDKTAEDEPAYDFEHEDTFIDVPDALRSRQFVHRAILSTIIRDTARVTLGSKYFTQLLGFNAIYQPAGKNASFAKYTSGVLGFSFGYSTKSGHAIELGLDLSSATQILVGYKYFFQSETSTFWPFLGGGISLGISGLTLSTPPVEAQVYTGSTTGEYLSLGAIIPLVDIALRAEAKFVFDGFQRLILDTGVGATFFF